MPAPQKGETKSDYMSRCVPQCMAEGLTQEQAVGKCSGIYDAAAKDTAKPAKEKRMMRRGDAI